MALKIVSRARCRALGCVDGSGQSEPALAYLLFYLFLFFSLTIEENYGRRHVGQTKGQNISKETNEGPQQTEEDPFYGHVEPGLTLRPGLGLGFAFASFDSAVPASFRQV